MDAGEPGVAGVLVSNGREVVTTDRYGRTFRDTSTFEVVDRIPAMGWTR